MQVKGNNIIDTDKRVEAMTEINKLPTKVLTNIKLLCNNERAISFLEKSDSVNIITSFLA